MKSCSSLEFFQSPHLSLNEQQIQYLFEFDQLHFPYPWSRKDWDKFLSSYDYSAVLKTGVSGQLDGFLLCFASSVEDVAHLVKIVVFPDQRQQGIAGLLLNFWCQKMKTLGHHKSLYLEVEKSNHQAINFYHKHQFLVLRTLKDFYGPQRDAQAMALALDNKENT